MKVGITIAADYPRVGEVRPTKLARSLQEAGHEVVFLSWNSRQRPVTEDLGFARVHRFSYFLKSRLFPLLGAPLPLNPLWAVWIAKIIRKERLDILISSNIRLALQTFVAAKLLGKPMVLDLEESNREAVKRYPRTRLHHYIIRNSHVVGLLEDLCVRLADHTWVVVEERLLSLPRKLRRPDKVSVVCHTPSLDELRPSDREGAKSPKDSKFTLVYVGLFAPGIGSVEPILEALPYALERDDNVQFLIGGGGTHLLPLVEQLGIQDHVVLCGLIRPEEVPRWLQQGDLGIIAYPVNPFTESTVSNKLFHYMAAGLPVLSTDMAPTRRILEEVGCGTTIPRDSNSKRVAKIILKLKNSPGERAAMAQRARQAILKKYNWAFDFKRALDCLEKLVAREVPGRDAQESLATGARSPDSEP